MTQSSPASAPSHGGLLAEYVSPEALLQAAIRVRRAGFRAWEAYSPFPVPGLEQVLELGPSRLPWLALGGGLGGALGGVWLEWWTSTVGYPWLISGKSFLSLPESIPVAFAFAMLGATAGVLLGLLAGGRWFEYWHRLDEIERFRRVTDDRFCLVIEACDPAYDETTARQALAQGHPIAIEVLPADGNGAERTPKAVLFAVIAMGILALLPFPLVAALRQGQSARPRVYWSHGMDQQAPLRAQAESRFFGDGRAARQPSPGTVAWGQLGDDEHYQRGKIDGAWARVLPPRFAANRDAMQRGRERYDIYCAPCHGLVGDGDGAVSRRAEELAEGTWVPTTNLHQDTLLEQPVGQLYDAITNGVRTMAGLRTLLEPDDRWAIVLYLRALQRSRRASLTDIPPAEREALE